MAGSLGRAFVQVYADLSKFTPGLKPKIKAALDESTKNIDMPELDKSMEAAGESAAEHVAEGMDRKIKNEMEKEGKKGGLSFSKGLSATISGIAAAFMPTLIALGVEAAAALAPAATALAATIPAAIGTAVGAIAVLKMATDGVGAALKTAFDPKKAAQFQAAMQKLTPAARSFVNEIRSLHPALHQLQQDFQQTFFVQLQGVLTRVSNTILPTLRTGLHQLSYDLGRIGRGVLMAFSNGNADLASIFIAAHQAIRPFIPALYEMVRAFLTIGAVAGPMFASLSGGFATLLRQFAAFISSAADSGALAQFFEDALVVLRQLGGILGGVFHLITNIVSVLQSTGGEALGMVGRLLAALNDFLSSADGKNTLVALFTLFNTVLTSLFMIIGPLIPVVGQLVTLFANGLTDAIVKLTPYLVGVADFLAKHPDLIQAAVAAWLTYKAALMAVSIAEGIVDALNPVGLIVLAIAAIAAGAYLIYKNWGVVSDAFKSLWETVKGFFSGVWATIQSIGAAIGNWFTVTLPAFFASIPGAIGRALSALPGLLWNLFLGALNLAGQAIGMGIGLIIAAFVKLPGLIWNALVSIGHLFVDLWHLALAAGQAVLMAGVNAILWVFIQLPNKIAGFVARLPGIIGGAFRTAWDWAKREVANGADAVVNFVARLPGRISGFMRNVGHDILSGLKSGINSVISGFNSGIDRVASVVHIGLPHIPMLASGGLVTAPTLAMVGEAGPEAVVPMSNPSRARAVAQRTGLLDMLGTRSGHSEMPSIRVYLGTREITDIVDVQVDKKLNDQANELAYGTR